MRVVLHGGFGEKGRTCVAVESHGYRLLLDAGIKTSARGTAAYYPAIEAGVLAETDAIVITHGHEDHAGALGWCLANGFRGRVLMTRETERDAALCLAHYAEPAHAALARDATIERLPIGDPALRLGPFTLATGRSGHVAGGVWCVVDDGHRRFLYCGDVVPASPVFPMDRVPRCDAAALDASYGDDELSAASRARQVRDWVRGQANGCVLPTPLFGRSAELLAIVPGALAVAPGMREALATQIEDRSWLVPGIEILLARRLAEAVDWFPGAPFPRGALVCHDAMGLAGPSVAILAAASAAGHPVLFTGHLPAGSPGARMATEGRAHWIRLPTHPTLAENVGIARECGAATLVGHSCEPAILADLASHLPQLRTTLATGDRLDL